MPSSQSVEVTHNATFTTMVRGRFKGGPRRPVPPPSKIFYLYVTATINSKKFSFNDV